MNHNANDQDKVYFSKYVVGEPYAGYPFRVDLAVCFTNEEKRVTKQIVDHDGSIFDFPGVEYADALKKEWGNRDIAPVVKYEAVFEKVDDRKYIMVWTVQPDGRYWMDSWGFGGEDYESLSLYTYIDADGNYTMPFRLYSIGYRFYGDQLLKRDQKFLEKYPDYAKMAQ